jgi:DNA-binding transcriptional LysR family regulator
LQVQEVMELDSSEVVIGMVRAGLGAGVIPAGRLRQLPPGEVVAMPFGEPPIHRHVALIERINNPRSDLSQLVYDEVKQMTTVGMS